MKSPCINVCRIDPASGLCRGCKRTVEEITRWTLMTPAERRSIMKSLPDRANPEGYLGK